MILKVKHRVSYYRRYQLDIWGVLRTVFLQKLAPVNPTDEDGKELFRQPDYRPHRRKWLDLLGQHPSAKQPTPKPWAYRSRRLGRLLEMFYKSQEQQGRYRRQRGRRFIYHLQLPERHKSPPELNLRFVSLRLVKLYYISYSYRQFRALARTMRRRRGAFEENFLMALESRVSALLYRMTLLGNPFHCLDFVRRGLVFVNGCCQARPQAVVGLHQMITFNELGRRWLFHDLQYRLGRHRLLFNVPRHLMVSWFFLFAYQRRPPRRKDLVFPIALDFYRATGYAF